MPDVPGVLNYPTALDTAVSLVESANAATTTLTAGYTAGDATLTVASNVLFPTSGLLALGTQGLILRYTGKSSTTGFTGVVRASTALELNNPADTNIANGSAVAQRITSNSLGVLRSAVLALETRLGITGAVPAVYQGRIVVADEQAGADLGAKINAADAILGANGGTILVLNPGSAIATSVVISSKHVLRFGPGAFSQSASITINGDNAAVCGSGEGVTTLDNTTTSIHSIFIADGLTWPQIRDIRLTRSATPNSGVNGVTQLGTLDHGLIDNVWSEGHWRGFQLGPVGYARFQNCTATNNYGQGVLFAPTATVGTLQWDIENVICSSNADAGFYVLSTAGPAQISLGTWTKLVTFANGSYGLYLAGTVGVPIQALRLRDCFFGEDGNHGVFLDSYGGGHVIENCYFELAGSAANGRNLATAATNTGCGIRVSTNNTDVQIVGCYSTGQSLAGIYVESTYAQITGNNTVNNGRVASTGQEVGILVNCSSGAEITGNTSLNKSGSTQLYGVYSVVDTIVCVGNQLQGATSAIGMTTGPVVSTVFGNYYVSGSAGVTPNIADGFGIRDAKNIVLGSTTGTQFGTAITQKLAFYGTTPVVQRANANQAAAPAGGTGATAGAYDTSAHRDSLIALVNEMRTVLVNLGLMKGSA